MNISLVQVNTVDGGVWLVKVNEPDVVRYVEDVKKFGLRINEGNAFIQYPPHRIGKIDYSYPQKTASPVYK